MRSRSLLKRCFQRCVRSSIGPRPILPSSPCLRKRSGERIGRCCPSWDDMLHVHFDALAIAEPAGFIRLFVDEGLPMAHLLSEAAAHGMMPDYIGKLLAIFEAKEQKREDKSYVPAA